MTTKPQEAPLELREHASAPSVACQTLTIDIGNTRTVCGLFCGEQLHLEWSCSSSRLLAALRSRSSQLEALEPAAKHRLTEVAIASVNPELNQPLAAEIHQRLNLQPYFLDHSSPHGLNVLCEPPSEVGPDRLANAAEAHVIASGRGAVVVDFGTATTFDCISPGADYLGGLIAAGVGISASVLAERTAKLPTIRVEKATTLVGRTTKQAMAAGTFFGHCAMVEGIVGRLRKELAFDPLVIATGGWAQLCAPSTRGLDLLEPTLTLRGIFRVLRNRSLGTEPH